MLLYRITKLTTAATLPVVLLTACATVPNAINSVFDTTASGVNRLLDVVLPTTATDYVQAGQVWRGTYTCRQGLTNLDLNIIEVRGDTFAATFNFYRDSQQQGAFLTRGDMTGTQVELKPHSWIRQPSGYSMVGLKGFYNSNAKTLSGNVHSDGCTTFTLRLVETQQSTTAQPQATPTTTAPQAAVQVQTQPPANNLYHITERLIVPKGQSPNWQRVEAIPKGRDNDWDDGKVMYAEDACYDGFHQYCQDYRLSRSINDSTRLTVAGLRRAPEVAIFRSDNESRNTLNAPSLSQLVNTNNLTKLTSNCAFTNISRSGEVHGEGGYEARYRANIEYQNLYRWSRPQSEPLYIAEIKDERWDTEIGQPFQGSPEYSTRYLITYTMPQLAKAIADHGWNTDAQGRTIACTFR